MTIACVHCSCPYRPVPCVHKNLGSKNSVGPNDSYDGHKNKYSVYIKLRCAMQKNINWPQWKFKDWKMQIIFDNFFRLFCAVDWNWNWNSVWFLSDEVSLHAWFMETQSQNHHCILLFVKIQRCLQSRSVGVLQCVVFYVRTKCVI